MVINKYKNIIIDKYSEYDEDSRLISDRGHNVEYLTAMRYIQKFLKPGAKILEIGAATGRYSIALAKMGFVCLPICHVLLLSPATDCAISVLTICIRQWIAPEE